MSDLHTLINKLSTQCVLPALLACIGSCIALQAQVTLQLQPGPSASTVAGSGRDGAALPGAALASPLGSPRGVTYDSSGNLLVADARNHVVLKITVAGALTVVAGNGRQGYAGDGGSATAAEFNEPTAVVADAAGNVYIADTGNHCIRKVNAAGIVTTIAGSGSPGTTGDGGPATAARLRQPRGLTLDTTGNLYIADTGNHRVRELRTDGTLVAIAGTGAEGDDGDTGPALAATLREPVGLALISTGGLLIADSSARRVRLVLTTGTITAYTASTRRPEGLAADASGSAYIADAGNQALLQSATDGTSTIAGTGVQGVFTAGAPTTSPLDSPAAVAIGSNGDIILSDRRNHQVQRVSLPKLDFGNIAVGTTSATQLVTLKNAAESPLPVLAFSVPPSFASVATGTTCSSTPFMLPPSSTCAIALAFTPTNLGAQSGVAQVRISGSAPQSIFLVGTGSSTTTPAGSATLLSSNGTISYAGAPVTLTAAVTGTRSTVPTGTVSLYEGTSLLTSATLSGGSATIAMSSLTQGQHVLSATYSGNVIYAASTSGTVTETVVAAPDFTMGGASASYSSTAGAALAIGMVLTPVNGTLNHVVTFSVTGLPKGTTYTLAPTVSILSSNPLPVTLTLQLPTVLSRLRKSAAPMLAACLIGCVALLPRRRRIAAALCLVLAAMLCIGGCGGFRGTAAATIGAAGGPGGSGGVFTYTALITATTTGVQGDALTHSTTVGLVVTQ